MLYKSILHSFLNFVSVVQTKEKTNVVLNFSREKLFYQLRKKKQTKQKRERDSDNVSSYLEIYNSHDALLKDKRKILFSYHCVKEKTICTHSKYSMCEKIVSNFFSQVACHEISSTYRHESKKIWIVSEECVKFFLSEDSSWKFTQSER